MLTTRAQWLMKMGLLKHPRVSAFFEHLAYLPAAWVVGNYGDQWVAYIEGGTILLYIVYSIALLLLMYGLLAPVMLFPKRWRMIIGIPVSIAILTMAMPYMNDLKVKADNNPIVHKKAGVEEGLSL